MAHHRLEPGPVRQVDRVERLRERADLVDLYQHRVGRAGRDAACDALRVGDEEVVADDLDPRAEPVGERLPTVPVLFGEGVFDRDDRVCVDELLVVGDQLVG